MDERCAGDACAKMKTQTAAQANACMKSQTAVEDVEGCEYSHSLLINFRLYDLYTDL